MVSGPVLLIPPGGDWWGLELFRFRTDITGLPLPYVPFFTVALSDWSVVIGLLVSGGGVSVSDLITYAVFFDGDLVNRPSGPLGPVPLLLLLQSWLKSQMGLLMDFLCIILPFGVVTVWFVSEIAIFGLSVYALSNFDF